MENQIPSLQHPRPQSRSVADASAANEPRTVDPDEAVADSSPRSFGFFAAGDLSVQPIKWLVDGYLEQNTMAVLYGGSETDNWILALDLSCCVATNTLFHGQTVHQGAVFYIAGASHGGIAQRLHGWSENNDVSLKNAPLYISSHPVDLTIAAHITQVALEITALSEATSHAPALIVIDTLSRRFSGNEYSAADMGRLVRLVDELRSRWNATVMVLSDLNSTRGSSTLDSAADAVYELSRTTGDRLITLNARKMRNTPEPAPKTFDLVKFLVET